MISCSKQISTCAALILTAALSAAAQPEGAVQNITVTGPNGGDGFEPAVELAVVNPIPTAKTSKAAAPGSNPLDNWPVNLGLNNSGYAYTPTLYDADGDGADEIFLTGGHTFGLRGDGSFLPGWPTSEMQYMGYGTNGNKPGPSVADVNQAGNAEVLWTLRDWWAGSSEMWCFNARGFDGADLPEFPQRAPDDLSNALDTPFVLGDTNGDGNLEAWGAHTLGNNFIHYRISALDHTGTRLFTIDLDNQENVLSLYFGDIDGDGTEEMFAVTWLSPYFRLHVFNPDGSPKSGYPITLHTLASGWLMFGPPIPADLDNDGDLEILLGHWGSGASFAQCYHHDGTAYSGFPFRLAAQSQLFYLSLGDVTGDGEPELLFTDNHLGADYRLYAVDLATGTVLPGWPFGLTAWPKGFPAVVDVDDDAIQDICVTTDAGELYAISGQGQVIAGYPKQMSSASISGVAAGDIDGDGLFELVAATWDGFVYAWDTPSAALPDRADWPMRGVDARNTGVYRRSATCYPDCDQSTGAGVLDIFDFLCFQNSFVLSETYACDCDISTGLGVCDIFDFLCFQNAFVAGCP